VSLLLILHGAIHLLGYLKPWGVIAVPQLSGRTLVPLSEGMGRAVGLLWLLACLTLLAAGALRLMRDEVWWVVASVGLVLSQALIVLQWHDAKAGTVANLLILFAVVVAGATSRFKRDVDQEVRALLARAPAWPATVVHAEELKRLPAPVREWLEVSGVVGRERVHTVRLKQRGQLRTSPDQPWMPAEAEQYFSVDQPGFVWRVKVKMMRLLPIAGRDRYRDGKGHMLIKAASLVNVVNATGDKIDQGTLLRFLGEIVWFPSAALSPYITWESSDARSATATMRYGGVTASALFSFDERGRVSSISADRYLGSTGSLERWIIPATEWRVVRGVQIPVKGEVIWKLQGGDFSYYRWEIVDVEYNRPEIYGHNAGNGEAVVRHLYDTRLGRRYSRARCRILL
jgi:Family of unknown function (DUF6544)